MEEERKFLSFSKYQTESEVEVDGDWVPRRMKDETGERFLRWQRILLNQIVHKW